MCAVAYHAIVCMMRSTGPTPHPGSLARTQVGAAIAYSPPVHCMQHAEGRLGLRRSCAQTTLQSGGDSGVWRPWLAEATADGLLERGTMGLQLEALRPEEVFGINVAPLANRGVLHLGFWDSQKPLTWFPSTHSLNWYDSHLPGAVPGFAKLLPAHYVRPRGTWPQGQTNTSKYASNARPPTS